MRILRELHKKWLTHEVNRLRRKALMFRTAAVQYEGLANQAARKLYKVRVQKRVKPVYLFNRIP